MTMNDEPYIKVEHLNKSFGSQQVLHDVSFDVRKGELLAIIGGSGAGKSVLLKHLIGLLDPDGGTVSLEGRKISNVSERDKSFARSQIGFMFQQGALFDSMTVAENVAFPLIEAGESGREDIENRVEEALVSVGLEGQGQKMPASLSGGMIKRVAVARAIVSRPHCLLYDEPTAGLDPIVSDSVSYLIRSICVQSAITTLVVTHDMSSVMHIADRIIYLSKGRIYWQGSPLELVGSDDPALRNFWQGLSGEDWSAVQREVRPDLQRELVDNAVAKRY